MTRGPLPKKAINKAQENAMRRGRVLSVDEMKESHYDFTIYGSCCTVYVRIKRIRTHVATPEDIGKDFDEDVRMIRRIPMTPVVAREIWALTPWGCWQYFLIPDDRIVEIHRDGTPVVLTEPTGETKLAQAGTSRISARTGIPASSPAGMPG